MLDKSTMKTVSDKKATEKKPAENRPEFKPGNTPHCQFGNEVLNFNVPWAKVLRAIFRTARYTMESLTKKVGTQCEVLQALLQNDTSKLNFKTGAKLLAVLSCLYPEHEAKIACRVEAHGAKMEGIMNKE